MIFLLFGRFLLILMTSPLFILAQNPFKSIKKAGKKCTHIRIGYWWSNQPSLPFFLGMLFFHHWIPTFDLFSAHQIQQYDLYSIHLVFIDWVLIKCAQVGGGKLAKLMKEKVLKIIVLTCRYFTNKLLLGCTVRIIPFPRFWRPDWLTNHTVCFSTVFISQIIPWFISTPICGNHRIAICPNPFLFSHLERSEEQMITS